MGRKPKELETLPKGIRKRGEKFQARYGQVSETFDTLGEAERWRARVMLGQVDNAEKAHRQRHVNVTDFVEAHWIDSLRMKSQKHAERYFQCWRDFIKPAIGDMKVKDVKDSDIENFLADLHEDGLSEGSLNKIKGACSSVFTRAMKEGLVSSNPCIGVTVLASVKRPFVFLTQEELLKLANTIDPLYRVAILVAGHGGFRASELWSLRLRDFDEVHSVFTVTEAGVEKRKNLRTGKVTTRTKTTKSGKSRGVPVHPELGKLVVAWAKEKDLQPDSLLFTSPWGKRVDHSTFRKRFYVPAVEKADLGKTPRFHDLRHTCASLHILRGKNIEYVRRVLGHSTQHMTELYAHIFPWAFYGEMNDFDIVLEDNAFGEIVPLTQPQKEVV